MLVSHLSSTAWLGGRWWAYLEPQATPNTSRPTTSPRQSNCVTAPDSSSPPVSINSYRYKLTFCVPESRCDFEFTCMFRLNRNLTVLNTTHTRLGRWIIDFIHSHLLSFKGFWWIPGLFVMLRFSVLGYCLTHSQNFWTFLWFILLIFFSGFFVSSFIFASFYFLQIVAGIYPVSQLQEPYSSVGYLCERTPFLSALKLKHPSLQENEPQQGSQGSEEPGWTAWDVCEGKLKGQRIINV